MRSHITWLELRYETFIGGIRGVLFLDVFRVGLEFS